MCLALFRARSVPILSSVLHLLEFVSIRRASTVDMRSTAYILLILWLMARGAVSRVIPSDGGLHGAGAEKVLDLSARNEPIAMFEVSHYLSLPAS